MSKVCLTVNTECRAARPLVRGALAPALGLLVGSVVACTPVGIDQACVDRSLGDPDAPPAAQDLFERVTCYRRFAGLGLARMDAAVNQAALDHAVRVEEEELVATNVVDHPEFGRGYDLSRARLFDGGGRDAAQRLADAGFPVERADFVWSYAIPVVRDTDVALADQLVHDPYARDLLFTSDWLAGGYGQVEARLGPFGFLHILARDRGQSWTTYPVDGQQDVPVDYADPLRFDPPWDAFGPRGYPVTLTVGGRRLADDRPQLRFGELVGPAGPVETDVLTAGSHEFGVNRGTVGLVPTVPLSPDTTYQATFEVQVGDHIHQRVFSFTTGQRSAVP